MALADLSAGVEDFLDHVAFPYSFLSSDSSHWSCWVQHNDCREDCRSKQVGKYKVTIAIICVGYAKTSMIARNKE